MSSSKILQLAVFKLASYNIMSFSSFNAFMFMSPLGDQ